MADGGLAAATRATNDPRFDCEHVEFAPTVNRPYSLVHVLGRTNTQGLAGFPRLIVVTEWQPILTTSPLFVVNHG